MSEVLNVEKLFGENVFTLGKMQERLPKKAFAEVKRVMEHGGELYNATADVVAKTMKDWSSCRNEWDMLEALCSHFYRERLFYQNALQVEGQNSFREYFCGMLRPVLMLLTQNLVEEGRKKEFYIAFLCEGVLGELVYWLREGSKITPEEFVEDLHDISLGLARKIIAEEAGTQNVIPILQNKEV